MIPSSMIFQKSQPPTNTGGSNYVDTKILSTSRLVTKSQYNSEKQGLERN